MDVINKLIVLVREQPAIYDLRDAQHRNKDFLATAWNNVAAQLGMKVSEVKLKWQNLRSNYMREKRKIAANVKTTWPYFSQLSFLDETLQYKQSIKTKKPDEKPYETQHIKDEFCDFDLSENERLYNLTTYDETTTEYSYVPEDEICEPSPPKKQALHDEDYIDTLHLQRLSQCVKEPSKRKHSYREEDFTEMIAFNHMENPQHGDNDPDALFLKSLLPTMKKLDHLQCLEFKSEVIQLLRQKLMDNVPAIEVVACSGSTSQGVQYDVKDFNKKSEDDVNLVVLQNVRSNLL